MMKYMPANQEMITKRNTRVSLIFSDDDTLPGLKRVGVAFLSFSKCELSAFQRRSAFTASISSPIGKAAGTPAVCLNKFLTAFPAATGLAMLSASLSLAGGVFILASALNLLFLKLVDDLWTFSLIRESGSSWAFVRCANRKVLL